MAEKKPYDELTGKEKIVLKLSGIKKADYEASRLLESSALPVLDASLNEPPRMESVEINQITEAIKVVESDKQAELYSTPQATVQPQTVESSQPQPVLKKSMLDKLFGGKKKQSGEVTKYKRVGGRKMWLVWTGAGCLLLGGIGFWYIMNHINSTIAMLSIFMLIGGGLALWQGLITRGEQLIVAGGKKVNALHPGKTITTPCNCLNIYPNRVVFEALPDVVNGQPNPLFEAHPRRCRNDKKFYYVNISGHAFNGKESPSSLKSFLLPDTQYKDPRNFSRYLNLPAHRALMKKRASLLQKISPLIIVGAMVVIGILMIATQPTPKPAQAAGPTMTVGNSTQHMTVGK